MRPLRRIQRICRWFSLTRRSNQREMKTEVTTILPRVSETIFKMYFHGKGEGKIYSTMCRIIKALISLTRVHLTCLIIFAQYESHNQLISQKQNKRAFVYVSQFYLICERVYLCRSDLLISLGCFVTWAKCHFISEESCSSGRIIVKIVKFLIPWIYVDSTIGITRVFFAFQWKTLRLKMLKQYRNYRRSSWTMSFFRNTNVI